MAEPRAVHRSPQSPSYIPVIAPKPSMSSLPSSLSVPQLGLVPSSRQPSGSGPPSHSMSPPTQNPPVAIHSPNAGLSPLRSLRNFLPFGAGKQQVLNGGTSGGSKLPLVGSFGSRRSMTVDRKVSGAYQRQGSEEELPVLDIDGSFQRHVQEGSSDAPSASQSSSTSTLAPLGQKFGLNSLFMHSDPIRPFTTPDRKTSEPVIHVRRGKELPVLPAEALGQQWSREGSDSVLRSASSPPFTRDTGPPVITYTPDPPLSTELSTIIEADMSGLSKHFPSFDDSHDIADEQPAPVKPLEVQSPDLPLYDDHKGGQELDANDTSALDLSTSQLREEVIQALRGGIGWSTGIVVEDADSHPSDAIARKSSGDQDAEVSFHLDTLDPELAALLSPNRLTGSQSIPSSPMLLPSNDLPRTRANSPRSIPAPLQSPASGSPVSAGSPSSPVRTSAASRSAVSRIPSSSSVPRLARSPTQTSPLRSEREIVFRTASEPTLLLEDGRRASSDGIRPRRAQAPPSPLSADHPRAAPLVRANSGREAYRNQSASSRLVTPARSTLYTPLSTRTFRTTPSASPNSRDVDSVSPSSRASSALSAAPVRRLHRPRQSIGDESRPSFGMDRDAAYLSRTRKRSMSMGENLPRHLSARGMPLPGRSTAEYIGPRTQKAFAAAGLFDSDRENASASGSGMASKFGSIRSTSDRDFRSQYAPSRLAFSEAGSSSSWRSVPRNMSPSEGASGTPRTAFSTAATSVSGASSPQHVSATLQTMHEKHTMETGTLLSALAESQRTVQSLREENMALMSRMQELELKLSDAQTQIRRQQYTARPAVDRIASRPSSSEGPSHRRLQPRVHGFTSTTSMRDVSPRTSPQHSLDVSEDDTQVLSVVASETNYRNQNVKRRISNASSVFAFPPSNMSMIAQEDATSALTRSRAGSFRSRSPSLMSGAQQRMSMSVSSAGNISPTTANFSMNEMAGSPRSLYLRPEHELHLGDMASLDLQFEDDEDDADERGVDGG